MKNGYHTLDDLRDGRFYKVKILKSILEGMGLPHSTFTIRDYETWKCASYRRKLPSGEMAGCGKRHDHEVGKCERCGGPVRPPRIRSPRRGGSSRGHRQYTADDIREVIGIIARRK